MTDLDKAIEAMRARTTDDGHIASVSSLVDAAKKTLDLLSQHGLGGTHVANNLREALEADYDVAAGKEAEVVVYHWARFRVTVANTETGKDDVEYFSDREGVRDALEGGMVLLSIADQDRMMRLPPKVGEKNECKTHGDQYVVTIERVRED